MNKFFQQSSNRSLFVLTLAIALFDLWLIITQAPMVKDQEWAQRIFYYHVPLAWCAFIAFFCVMIYSILYLKTNNVKWDARALAMSEVGIIFTLLILVTGPLWATPIWGKPWTWEPRLTTTLLLFLIYIGYFMVREFGGVYERASRFAAVIGILAFIDVPIIYYAVDFWSPEVQSHPQRDMGNQIPEILQIFFFSLFTFSMILYCMYRFRVHVAMTEAGVMEDNYV